MNSRIRLQAKADFPPVRSVGTVNKIWRSTDGIV